MSSLSFVWPAVRTFAVLDRQGQPVRCRPVAGPVKVVYRTRDAAAGCARMLRELGQGDSRAYECERTRGAVRRPHFHLTTSAGDHGSDT